ncbi:hypothetical protein ADK75_31190 [Streptomyces virginiae]|uniref:Uncharacterized protein n=1 Tax=Streptomyces virginiae TaxID=1961 RepID=A0A0L8M5F3_STRVG|nr:hypothetical protein [Streptomyces virginiae]KOG45554.1 hypothetical protein ADK75_31190 [Streptomyces virginiae]
MTTIPAARSEDRRAPVAGLSAHSTALRAHADRLRASAEAIDRRGPEAEAFRRQVETLAARCVTAADGLTLSATHLEAYERPR